MPDKCADNKEMPPPRKNSMDDRLYSVGLVLNLLLCIALVPMFFFAVKPLIFEVGLFIDDDMKLRYIPSILVDFVKYWGVPIALLFAYKRTKKWLEADKVCRSLIVLIFATLLSIAYFFSMFTWLAY